MKRRNKQMTSEDRVLWSRVARTATPLPGKTLPEEEPPLTPAPVTQPTPPAVESTRSPPAVPATDRHPRRFDAPTRERLANGRLDIAGRVDLHGMTQEEAHALLLAFLRRAYDTQRRYVLVITGKGSAGRGEGVLRRVVPQWLSTAPFRPIVGGFEEAAQHHGGAGALYVRLRRREGGR